MCGWCTGFSDMSWEEFRATRLGAAQNCSATLAGNHRMRATAAALPETVSYQSCSSVVTDNPLCLVTYSVTF